MNKGVLLLVAGILILLASLFADSIGLGSGSGMGWKQIVGAVVGAILAVVGGKSVSSRGARRGAA